MSGGEVVVVRWVGGGWSVRPGGWLIGGGGGRRRRRHRGGRRRFVLVVLSFVLSLNTEC